MATSPKPTKLDIQPLTESDMQGLNIEPMPQYPPTTFKDEPTDYWGGVKKAVTGGAVDEAARGGLTGYLKGATIGIPQSIWGALQGIGESISSPIQTIKGGLDVAAHPLETAAGLWGPLKETVTHAGSQPEEFGRLMGEVTGQPLVTAGLAKGAPPAMRMGGGGLERLGQVMAEHQPISGIAPRILDSRTARGVERLAGQGIQKLGSRIKQAGTPLPPDIPGRGVPERHGEIIPEMQSPWMEGEVIQGLPPERQLPASTVDAYVPPNYQRPVGPMLTSAVEMEPPAGISGAMNTPINPVDNWARTVMEASPRPVPETIYHLPSEISPFTPKGLLPAQTATGVDSQLTELIQALENQVGTSSSIAAPLDDAMSIGTYMGNASDDMYDLIQRMSGGRIEPRLSPVGITDVDNELRTLLQQMEDFSPKPVMNEMTPFADIKKRYYELVDKSQAGTLTGDELTEAQRVNKLFRNHPDFFKDSITPSVTPEVTTAGKTADKIIEMKKAGESLVVYDEAGNVRPLSGPDALNYKPKQGETFGIRSNEGFRVLEDNGGKVPSASKKPVETPKTTTQLTHENSRIVPREAVSPEVIQNLTREGFKFSDLDPDGNYVFLKKK